MLLLQRGHHRHHRFDKTGALWALGPKLLLRQRTLAESPARRVVRGSTLRDHERPQGLPELQSSRRCPPSWHPTCLARFQQPLHVAPDCHIYLARSHGSVRRGPMHHETSDGPAPQGSPLLRAPAPLDHGFDITPQCAHQSCRRQVGTSCRRSSDPSPTIPEASP